MVDGGSNNNQCNTGGEVEDMKWPWVGKEVERYKKILDGVVKAIDPILPKAHPHQYSEAEKHQLQAMSSIAAVQSLYSGINPG